MKADKTWKQNDKKIWTFFAINLFFFLIITFAFSIEKDKDNLLELLYKKGIWVAISPLVVFILNGVVAPDHKATLVFWKVKNGLPGCRAFTHYANMDPRIDIEKIKAKHGDLPINPEDQNRKWYSIYKSIKNNPMIDNSHQEFLLARDLCALAFLFLLLLPIPVLVFSVNNFKYLYVFALLSQYILLVVVARNYGARFVCNVLALDSLRVDKLAVEKKRGKTK